MRHARRLPKAPIRDHSTITLLGVRIVGHPDGDYQLSDLGRKPDATMRESTERIEEHLRAAPGGCSGREVNHLLAVDGAKTAVDVGLFRQLLFEKANAEPP